MPDERKVTQQSPQEREEDGAPVAIGEGGLPEDVDETITAAGIPIIEAPPTHQPSMGERVRHLIRQPGLRLVVYYALLIGVATLLIEFVPFARGALVSSAGVPALDQGLSLLTGDSAIPAGEAAALTLETAVERAGTTLLVILAALSLVLPVGWVYMFSKRLRYDPALVRSVIVLPIVVAGITLVVKYSIALAFALAGIVAAVRFRNTLKDPRDAVYIFLTIAIGLAAGVQALDVALVMSVVFNVVILLLWRFNVGSIYSGRYGRTGILSVGESALLLAQAPDQQREIRRRLLRKAEKMKTDGILLVHSENPQRARHTVQEALSEMAKDWRLADIAVRDDGLSTLEYLVRLKKKTVPAELVGSLDDRWSSQVDAAEYIPFRTRSRERK